MVRRIGQILLGFVFLMPLIGLAIGLCFVMYEDLFVNDYVKKLIYYVARVVFSLLLISGVLALIFLSLRGMTQGVRLILGVNNKAPKESENTE